MTVDQVTHRPPTFYDIRAVAEMFQVSRMTVYRAIHGGELAAVRIRSRWLVPARVIDGLITAAEDALPARPGPEWASDGLPVQLQSRRSKEV